LNGGKGKVPDQLTHGAPRTSSNVFEASPEPNPNKRINEVQQSSNHAHIHIPPDKPSQPMKDPFRQHGFPGPKLQISPTAISDGIDLYFDLFHRQPIWCFDREDLEQNQEISTELIYSILGLTARFMPKREKPRYEDHARWNIMLRVANGTVELETIESLCLLSYSAFIGMSCLIPS
jgi:hypothetical protein